MQSDSEEEEIKEDRSHPYLRCIDEQIKPNLTYPGWEDDIKDVELYHVGPTLMSTEKFKKFVVHKIMQKQRMFDGKRNHPRLVELDSHEWTYNGWEQDVLRAEQAHLDFGGDSSVLFDPILESMKVKQQLHDGVRSHPYLVELDTIKPYLNYPGWEQDFSDVEQAFVYEKVVEPERFEQFGMHLLRAKQALHDGDRSHPRLIQLDSKKWSYPGWEIDFHRAEDAHLKYGGDSPTFPFWPRAMAMMEEKQRLYGKLGKHEEQAATPSRKRGAVASSHYRQAKRAKVVAAKPSPEKDSPEKEEEEVAVAKAVPEGGDEFSCIICMHSKKSHAFIPCGHLAACGTCASEALVRGRTCPVCRRRITTTVEIFVS